VAALGHSNSINPWMLRDNYRYYLHTACSTTSFNPFAHVCEFRARLHNLLWLEEAQGVVNMRKFDLLATTLEAIETEGTRMSDPTCKLMVPGWFACEAWSSLPNGLIDPCLQVLRKAGLRSWRTTSCTSGYRARQTTSMR
jgi:hypothetical protein